jgi:hypothetical protein
VVRAPSSISPYDAVIALESRRASRPARIRKRWKTAQTTAITGTTASAQSASRASITNIVTVTPVRIAVHHAKSSMHHGRMLETFVQSLVRRETSQPVGRTSKYAGSSVCSFAKQSRRRRSPVRVATRPALSMKSHTPAAKKRKSVE